MNQSKNPVLEFIAIMVLAMFLALVWDIVAISQVKADTYAVEGKTFTEKADVVTWLLTHKREAVVTQTRQVVLNKKLGFKAVPKKRFAND